MTPEARERKRKKYESKFATFNDCTCGASKSHCESESWHGRIIYTCAKCKRSVYADKQWEVSVGWFLGMSGQVDGMVKPYCNLTDAADMVGAV